MKWLNDSGVRTYRKLPFRIDAVNRLLKNRAYIGEYRCGEVVTPGGVPAIVPLELFERVQDCLAKNKKAPARHKAEDDYLLTTTSRALEKPPEDRRSGGFVLDGEYHF